MRKGLSEKELKFISKLELKNKYFFTRDEIRNNFTSDNEMNVYIHRLKKKGRIIKLNKSKYFLIPIKAVGSKWSEHSFILIDEIMDGKDYCIVGKAAPFYWKLIDQIPFEYEVYNTKKHEVVNMFHTRINFKKRRKVNLPNSTIKEIQGHRFIIATKKESRKWI
jgi:predicted transcriptional regulator of viral defense system